MFNSNLCDRIIDIGLPANGPQTVPACYKLFLRLVRFTQDQSSPTKIARPGDGFLNLGHLGLILEPLIQGRSA